MDGLLAYLSIVALLAFLAWLHGGRQWRYLFLSAAMTGLALLSKSTTVILIPTVGLLLFIEGVRLFRHGERKRLEAPPGVRDLDPARGGRRGRSLAGALGRSREGVGNGAGRHSRPFGGA